MIAIDNRRAGCWQRNLLCAPEIWNYRLVHKMYIMIVQGDAACLCNIQVLLWNFNLLKSFRKTRNQAKMITTLMNQESRCCCQTSYLWLDSWTVRVGLRPKCVWNGVAEQSRVEGTRYRCPWGQSPPAHSAKTRRLHLQPVHSLPFSPAQDRFGAARGAACGESRERGQRLEIDGRTGRVWRETFGSNKSIRALFSWVRVWVSCNGQSGLAGQVCPDTYQLQLTLAPRSLKYTQHRKAASASFGGSFIRGSQDSLKYKTKFIYNVCLYCILNQISFVTCTVACAVWCIKLETCTLFYFLNKMKLIV